MKRRSNGRSHAAVAGFQFGKRTQGRRVTDDAGDLTPAGRVGGLPLGGGFGLAHSCGQQLAEFSRNGHGAAVEVIRHGAGFGSRHATELASRAGQRLVGNVAPVGGVGAEACGNRIRVSGMARQFEGEGGGLVWGELIHGRLPSVGMEGSSHVTSDTSTTVRQILICLLHNT